MQPEYDLRPKQRSKLRLWCGRLYYRLLRYLLWYFGGLHFARKRAACCRCVRFCHRTPLLRQFKDVDMQYQYNKITNLRLAAARLDGVVLRPGETFSYWRLIGRPTRRKGYKEGIVLFCGTFRPGPGGGLCQISDLIVLILHVHILELTQQGRAMAEPNTTATGGLCQMSNLIYWMTLHTPLTVTERYRHSYDVFPDCGRTQPFGSGATCVYPYRDLMIRNDTQTTFRLHVRVGEEFLEGEWQADRPAECTYRIVERDHCMRTQFWGGYSRHNLLFREVYDLAGNPVGEEYITRNDALMMYSPFLTDGNQ